MISPELLERIEWIRIIHSYSNYKIKLYLKDRRWYGLRRVITLKYSPCFTDKSGSTTTPPDEFYRDRDFLREYLYERLRSRVKSEGE